MDIRPIYFAAALLLVAQIAGPASHAQATATAPHTPAAASAPTAVPALVPYSGVALSGDGQPMAGEATVTFLIFKDEQGGEPLWAETQSVDVDPAGHYKVQLGSGSANGLPVDLFSTGEARWLEVQVAGERPQPRVLLASVPYALKAGDAATLGGLPVSAFALAADRIIAPAQSSATPQLTLSQPVTTLGGKIGYLSQFSSATAITDSPVFVGGANVGIGTTTPSTTLDVAGNTTFQGAAMLAENGLAMAAHGANSEPLSFVAASYGSLSKTVTAQQFVLRAESVSNNSLLPSGSLNLLFGAGASAPAETGFSFNPKGIIHFAAGQTFPGTGTITGVTAGTGLTGGGTAGSIALSVAPGQFPLLSGNNTFTGNQVVTGSENIEGGMVTPTIGMPATTDGFEGILSVGGQPFLHGYGAAGSDNVFVGGAGNFTTTGTYTSAVGFQALKAQSTGSSNTAMGLNSLIADTTGGQNTAVGAGALYSSTTGSYNTALGWSAGAYNGALLSNTTSVGAGSQVQQDNTVVLGNTTSTPGAQFVNVGIGTANPISALEASVAAPGAVGAALTLTNPGGDTVSKYGAVAVDFNTQPIQARGYNPGARIEAVDDGQNSNNLVFLSNTPGAQNDGLRQSMIITSQGQVGINVANPAPAASYDPVPALDVAGFSGQPGIIGVGGSTLNGTVGFQMGVWGIGGESTNLRNGGGYGGYFVGGTSSTGEGVVGDGLYAEPGAFTADNGFGTLAAMFQGSISVIGHVSSFVTRTQIDHPNDPANKYLVHAAVESSEMMNIYSGNAVTDDLGVAVVHLPDWFEAENGDFRYQLTVLGGRFAQAIVSTEIHDHQFTISTNATGVKVSWQVTGVRLDAYAKAHPLVVEQEKNKMERGFYMSPELYGQPEEKGLEWGRHPNMMRLMKARREASRQAKRPEEKTGPQAQLGAPASAVDRKAAPAGIAAPKPGAAAKPGQQAAAQPR